mgnify:CR=1 FL=1
MVSLLAIGHWTLTAKSTIVILPFEERTLILVQDNSLVGISVPNFPLKTYVVASLMPEEDIGPVSKIIACESRNSPIAKNPKSSAYGLCQFIDGTWNYVQKKWDMKLDRQNPADQLYACNRLWGEEGEKHWLESKSCWTK